MASQTVRFQPTNSESKPEAFRFSNQLNNATYFLNKSMYQCVITRLPLEKCKQDFEAQYEDEVGGIILRARTR